MPSPSDAATFVGRSAELDDLRNLAARARLGFFSLCLVVGMRGSGSSFLVREFASGLSDFQVELVLSSIGDSNSPLGLARRLLDQLDRTRSRYGEDIASLGSLTSKQLSSAILEAIVALAEERPLLLLLDDVHYADQESLSVLEAVFEQTSSCRALVLLAGNPRPNGWQDQFAAQRMTASTLNVVPLSIAGVQSFADEIPGSTLTAATIASMTGGNPMLVTALLRDARDSNSHESGSASALNAAVTRIVLDVDAADRLVLDALAVYGEPSTTNSLAYVLDVRSVVSNCERLVMHGVLDWQSGSARQEKIAFRSELVERRIYESVPRTMRGALHARAAERTTGVDSLRHRVGASDGDDLELAAALEDAANVERASDEPRAAHYLLWASRLGGTPQLAGRRLAEAVRMLVMAAHESEALEHRDDVRDLDPSFYRSEALAMLDFAERRVASAREHLIRAREQLEGTDDPELEARICLELAYASVTIGLGSEACEAAARALSISGVSRVRSIAMSFLAAGRALESGPHAALETLVDLPADPNECTGEQIPQLVQRGVLFGLLGRLDKAANDLNVVIRRHDSTFGRLLGLAPYIHLTWAQYMLGRWNDARATLDTAFEHVDTRGRSFDACLLYSLSTILHSGRGEDALAAEALRQTEASAIGADYIGPTINIALARAAVAQSKADFGEVAEILDQVGGQDALTPRARLYSAFWLPAEASADIMLRRNARARQTLSRLSSLPRDGAWLEVAEFWLNARLAETEGRFKDADENYQKGLNVGTSGGDPLWYRGLLVHSYGQFCIHHGSKTSAKTALVSASKIFEKIGAGPALKQCGDDILLLEATQSDGWSHVLTAREKEIAQLVGRGWTNPEIASNLFVSPKTVEYHLRNSYMKLGMTNRRELRDAIHKREN